jgi:ribosome maturation protein SDO1
MSGKIHLARFKKAGVNFEIIIVPDRAVDFKEGRLSDVSSALDNDEIFFDAKKGKVASSSELEKAFSTSDKEEVAKIIISKGELQLTSEHRNAAREQKKKLLVNMIHVNVVDPRTKLPHPVTRIEAALEQGKISIDYNKGVEEQFDAIISKLRPIIPISIEKKVVVVKIPSLYAGKSFSFVKSNSKVLGDEWAADGCYIAKVEMPAGFYPTFLDKVNAMTHGEVEVKEV